jgi:hypothetical protein
LPNVFTNNNKIVKSHIPIVNTLAKIEVLVEKSINTAANKSKARLKCGIPIGVKDKIPRKKKVQENKIGAPEEALPTKHAKKIDPSKLSVQNFPGNKSPQEETLENESFEEEQVSENNEISVNYVST